MTKETLAFIAPDTTRTGATILLLRLLGLLNNEGYSSRVLIRSDTGPLAGDFKSKSSEAAVYWTPKENPASLVRRKLFRATGNGFGSIFDGASVVINNTITNGVLLHSVRTKYKTPVASYIHELETMSRVYTDRQSVEYTIKYTDLFLVPSNAVADFLFSEYKVPRERLLLLDYYLPKKDERPGKRNSKFTIGGCGTTDWRKGADLFLQVAIAVARAFPQEDFQFVWKGANMQSNFVKHAGYELVKAGFPNLVTFEESNNDMDKFYEGLDVFLLASREDPYPLVVLEAAMAGVPTICFDRAGGSPEFVREGSGTVVPFLDVVAMANAIGQYISDRTLLQRHSTIARQQVLAKHSDHQRLMHQFRQAIDTLVTK